MKSSVDSFVQHHADEVHRSSRFSQLSEWEKEEIVERARRLARYGGCPSEVARRLARKSKRSPETIRYTLKNHDREHPEAAVFPFASTPLTDEQKKEDLPQQSAWRSSGAIGPSVLPDQGERVSHRFRNAGASAARPAD